MELNGKGVDEAWGVISSTIDRVQKAHVPMTDGRKKGTRRPIWMDDTTLKKVRKKHGAFKRYRESLEGKDYLEYAKLRNQAKWACRAAVLDFEKKLASETNANPKAFYKYVWSKMKTKETIGNLKSKQGFTVYTDEEKANALNEKFSSVFTEEDVNNLPTPPHYDHIGEITNIFFTTEAVEKKFAELNPNKAPGPDGLHPRILREMSHELAEPFTLLFKLSHDQGKLPGDWKRANVTPIFKKGSKADPGNYRPVNLTSTACKVMEAIIREQLMDHIKTALSQHQHGFVPGHSCTTNLLTAVDQWTKAMEDAIPIDAVYLDFRKAFDTVPHTGLAMKLESMGVSGRTLSWIQDFLAGRL